MHNSHFKIIHIAVLLLVSAVFCACGSTASTKSTEGAGELEAAAEQTADVRVNMSAPAETAAAAAPSAAGKEEKDMNNQAPKLLYMGHASLRIVTGEGKVIYIDPFSGEGYDLPADLILITHGHSDHTQTDLIKKRSDDCTVITWKEALKGNTHQTFTLPYVTVTAVEAGNNANHDIKNCVGYVLTFTNGAKVYASGDTSTTAQMSELAGWGIDYAFFCCDGVYNMDLAEAAKCAKLVAAKHNIPYHMVAANVANFDQKTAEKFDAPNRLILAPGQEISVE